MPVLVFSLWARYVWAFCAMLFLRFAVQYRSRFPAICCLLVVSHASGKQRRRCNSHLPWHTCALLYFGGSGKLTGWMESRRSTNELYRKTGMSDAEKPLREEAWNRTWTTVRDVLQGKITRITDKTSLDLAFCRLYCLFIHWMGI
jgi:hypothetical protein